MKRSMVINTLKKSIYEILEDDSDRTILGRTLGWFIVFLVILNIVALMLESMVQYHQKYFVEFQLFEIFTIMVFSFEYVLRVWSCTSNQKYSSLFWGRFTFALRPLLLMDLLAILPFFVGALGVDLRFLRAIRLIRLFRLLKLARYSKTLKMFGNVFRKQREELATSILFLLLVLLISGSLMYFAERSAQPEKFSSIPHSMWWAVTTLTTVGYGDTYPMTPTGKIIAAFIAILGIGMVALPAGILSSGFSNEISRNKKTTCPYCERNDDE